jgi:hypothetical protein
LPLLTIEVTRNSLSVTYKLVRSVFRALSVAPAAALAPIVSKTWLEDVDAQWERRHRRYGGGK